MDCRRVRTPGDRPPARSPFADPRGAPLPASSGDPLAAPLAPAPFWRRVVSVRRRLRKSLLFLGLGPAFGTSIAAAAATAAAMSGSSSFRVGAAPAFVPRRFFAAPLVGLSSVTTSVYAFCISSNTASSSIPFEPDAAFCSYMAFIRETSCFLASSDILGSIPPSTEAPAPILYDEFYFFSKSARCAHLNVVDSSYAVSATPPSEFATPTSRAKTLRRQMEIFAAKAWTSCLNSIIPK
mmetsp:Transcript_392/g.512  ORF Transcript_392/g.512 Transcript_392/m.512 type:complete len:238 (+) Transcript_392:1232-1945(+)